MQVYARYLPNYLYYYQSTESTCRAILTDGSRLNMIEGYLNCIECVQKQ
jgi:hypothetical protein